MLWGISRYWSDKGESQDLTSEPRRHESSHFKQLTKVKSLKINSGLSRRKGQQAFSGGKRVVCSGHTPFISKGMGKNLPAASSYKLLIMFTVNQSFAFYFFYTVHNNHLRLIHSTQLKVIFLTTCAWKHLLHVGTQLMNDGHNWMIKLVANFIYVLL